MSLAGIKIALVFPPYKESKDIMSLEEYKKNLGAIPPLTLAYVAAILEKIGCSVEIIDASALGLDKQQVIERLKKFDPDFLGFTLATFQFQYILDWIRSIKSAVNKPVIVGGVHMSVLPKETLSHPEINYGVIGDAEETLPELLEAVANKKDLKNIKGLCFRENGEIVINQPREPFMNLDVTPFPARHLLPNDKYYSLISKKKNFSVMITSRGCPFRCIFCDNRTILHRYRSAKNVADEMELCKKEFKINEIDIFDGTFSVNKTRAMQICDEIIKRRLKIRWSFRTRADLVSEEMLSKLANAGCCRIYYGIESGDKNILKNLNKEVELEYIKKIIYLTKRYGIDAFGYFMFGSPGETEDTIRNTIRLMKQIPLDYVQISAVYPSPNTLLYDMVKEKLGYDYWSLYTLGKVALDTLPRVGTDLSDMQIKRLVRKAYLEFYLRPSFIIRAISRIDSLEEVIISLKALLDMSYAYLKDKIGWIFG